MRLYLLVAVLAAAAAAQGPSIAGKWTGYSAGAVHTWQFQSDGSFLHVWVMPGSGHSVVKQERGEYRMVGDSLELSAVTGSTAVMAPHDSRTALLAGAQSRGMETRRSRLKVMDAGRLIHLDGMKLSASR